MKSFLQYLSEANGVGSGFEEKTASQVQKWLAHVGMDGAFSAKRFQSVSESDGNRDEDYSDIIVSDARSGESFFIECKEYDRSNVINVQYDISENGGVIPVKGKKRSSLDEAEASRISGITSALSECDGYRRFMDFLNQENPTLRRPPADYFFNRDSVSDSDVAKLVSAYNKLVRSGKVEADCKEFNAGNVRPATKNTLAVALAWRLADDGNTWDICRADDIENFGDMMRRRYGNDKSGDVKYIQFGDNLFGIDVSDNPLKIKDLTPFPYDARGSYALKFTPRFGTGSVYVTPRSEITSEFNSPHSFNNEKKWPELINKD